MGNFLTGRHENVLLFCNSVLKVICYCNMLLWSNGRSWIYSISLLASQYSFDSSLEV